VESTEMAAKMYAALLVYEASSPAPEFESLYEETVTLIRANSAKHAAERAREFARTRETSYQNEMGETVTLSLKRLVDVSEIVDRIDDGAEIYTRHFTDYDAYCTFETMPLSQ
jgi:hypothetical protein